MGGKETIEQRKYNRFCAAEDTFAVLHNGVYKLGQILDISIGGLGCKYCDGEKIPEGKSTLDIFLVRYNFDLKNIPYQAVCDNEIETDIPFSTTIMRRKGVQFVELTPHQQSHLEYFLQNHTIGEV